MVFWSKTLDDFPDVGCIFAGEGLWDLKRRGDLSIALRTRTPKPEDLDRPLGAVRLLFPNLLEFFLLPKTSFGSGTQRLVVLKVPHRHNKSRPGNDTDSPSETMMCSCFVKEVARCVRVWKFGEIVRFPLST